jgi:hypothetical protein
VTAATPCAWRSPGVDPASLSRHVLRLDEGVTRWTARSTWATSCPSPGRRPPELHDEPFTPQVVPPFRDAEDPFAP